MSKAGVSKAGANKAGANKRTKAQQAAQAAFQRRQREQLRQRRQRAAWVSAVAVAVLLVAGVVGATVWQTNRPTDAAVPAGATVDGAGLPVGTGPVTVEIYLDFLCPACAAFDKAARPTLDGYLESGTISVIYRPIAILDDRTTTDYSSRAAAAAGCAADAGGVDEFVAGMMANQPTEGTSGLSDEQIVAAAAGAGMTEPGLGECVRAGTYRDWARQNTNEAFDRGVTGTPTVFVDGTRLDQLSVDALVAAVEAAR